VKVLINLAEKLGDSHEEAKPSILEVGDRAISIPPCYTAVPVPIPETGKGRTLSLRNEFSKGK